MNAHVIRERAWTLAVMAAAGMGIALLLGAGEDPASAGDPAEAPAVVADSTPAPPGVTAYYFHTTARCASCRKIEAYSREALETAFPQELGDGRLVWRPVNVEDKGNEHFIKDYGLYTKSLVLVDGRAGREGDWKNLEKVWTLLGDKETFLEYVQAETRDFLTREP